MSIVNKIGEWLLVILVGIPAVIMMIPFYLLRELVRGIRKLIKFLWS